MSNLSAVLLVLALFGTFYQATMLLTFVSAALVFKNASIHWTFWATAATISLIQAAFIVSIYHPQVAFVIKE